MSDKIFGFATPAQKEFSAAFRKSAFENPEEIRYLKGLEELFAAAGGKFYFVELSADLKVRLARNETPHRMERKASKWDVAWSRDNLLRSVEKHMHRDRALWTDGQR